MANILTEQLYRRLVGHMMFWKRGWEEAFDDCDIPKAAKEEVFSELASCGYEYDEETNTLAYTL